MELQVYKLQSISKLCENKCKFMNTGTTDDHADT